MGGGAFDSYRVCERLARIEIGVATSLFATFLGTDPILIGATSEQRKEWLGRIVEQGPVVDARTAQDPQVREAAEQVRDAMGSGGADAGAARARLAEITAAVRSAKLSEAADEFDRIHTVQRALAVGSVDRIISAEALRPYIVDALDRGMSPV